MRGITKSLQVDRPDFSNSNVINALKRHCVLNANKAEEINKKNLCEYMEEQKHLGKLQVVELPDKTLYTLSNDDIEVTLDKETGLYMYTDAGKGKSNKRQYIKINNWMCPAYSFRVVFEGLMSDNIEHIVRYEKYKYGIYIYRFLDKKEHYYEGYTYNPKSKMQGPTFNRSVINHKNGDTMDNRDCNLEVVSYDDNNKHSRFMGEVAVYFPSLIYTEYDCQKHAMHKWIDKVGLSCNDITKWNSTHETQILAFKDKKGEFRSRFTKEQVEEMLKFFGKLQEEVKKEPVIKPSIKLVKRVIPDDRYIGYDF